MWPGAGAERPGRGGEGQGGRSVCPPTHRLQQAGECSLPPAICPAKGTRAPPADLPVAEQLAQLVVAAGGCMAALQDACQKRMAGDFEEVQRMAEAMVGAPLRLQMVRAMEGGGGCKGTSGCLADIAWLLFSSIRWYSQQAMINLHEQRGRQLSQTTLVQHGRKDKRGGLLFTPPPGGPTLCR